MKEIRQYLPHGSNFKSRRRIPDDYKVAKQADTLMLFYNLDKTRVDQILEDLGYQLPADYLEKIFCII